MPCLLNPIFVDGHFDYFHVLAIINSACIGMHVSFHVLAIKIVLVLECMFPFELVFSFFLDIYLGVELLDHVVVLFLVFKGASMLFSIETSPPNSVRCFCFLHILFNSSYW